MKKLLKVSHVLVLLCLCTATLRAQRVINEGFEQDGFPAFNDVKVGTPLLSTLYDVGMVSILRPQSIELLGDNPAPSAVIMNFSETATNNSFEILCDIRDLADNLVYSDIYYYSESLSPSQIDTVVFNTWILQSEGDYQVTMKVSLLNDSNSANDSIIEQIRIVTHQGIGGPDAMGYYWMDNTVENGPTYNWVDISFTGTSAIMYGVNQFYGDNNFSELIPIGFPFPFYGITRDSLYVDTNGEILLAPNRWAKPFPKSKWYKDGNPMNYHSPVPGYSEMPALIAVFWDDLCADEGIGDVLFQTMGTEPNRRFVIQWNNMRFVGGTGGTSTLCFQAILHENGDIIMQYKTVDNGQTGGSVPHVNGQSATIGIQNDDATIGLAYLNENYNGSQYLGYYPEGNLVHNNTAIKFSCVPVEDQIPPRITHKRVWNTFDNRMEITANITDISNILYDTLYYNYGDGWLSTSHNSITETNAYFYLIEDIPVGSTVYYYFTAVDGSENENRAVLNNIDGMPLVFKTLPTENTNILLLTPGNTIGFQDYQNKELPKYTMVLDSLDVKYDIFNWAAYDTYRFPNDYDILIAYSNQTRNTAIHDTLSMAIMDFLDQGTTSAPKNIFLASDDFASAQHALANHRKMKKFFTAYLRSAFNAQSNPPTCGGDNGIGGPDYLGYANGSIIGCEGTPIGAENLEINVYANDPDVILTRNCPDWYADEVSNPGISSNYSFVFEKGPINGNAYSRGKGCAVWLDNLIYKSYYISFDISQFINDEDIIGMISDAINWFAPQSFSISVVVSPEDGGEIYGAGNYPHGSAVTLTAIPNTGYGFLNWTENGEVVSEEQNYSFTATQDRQLGANFSLNVYEISGVSIPEDGGEVYGAGSYPHGSAVTLTAIPNTGYEFLNWTENGEVVSEEQNYSFIAMATRDLVANLFKIQGVDEQNDHTIMLYPNPVTDKLIIETQNHIDNISIYNLMGLLVYRQQDCINKVEIQTEQLPAGIYIINLITHNFSEVRIFVKK